MIITYNYRTGAVSYNPYVAIPPTSVDEAAVYVDQSGDNFEVVYCGLFNGESVAFAVGVSKCSEVHKGESLR